MTYSSALSSLWREAGYQIFRAAFVTGPAAVTASLMYYRETLPWENAAVAGCSGAAIATGLAVALFHGEKAKAPILQTRYVASSLCGAVFSSMIGMSMLMQAQEMATHELCAMIAKRSATLPPAPPPPGCVVP